MTDNRFALVEFQGSQLLTIFDGHVVRVAMKPLVEALGIDWASQFVKLKKDPVISKGVVLSTIPSERGTQQTLTLPIDLMHGWLFKLNPERVAPNARDRVIAYQQECYQVLHDYWTKGVAVNPRAAVGPGSGVQDLIKLIDSVKAERHPVALELKYRMLADGLTARGIDVPALEAFAPTLRDDAEADAVLELIDDLLRAQPDLDLHRRPDLIAVRGKDLDANGVRIAKSVAAALKRHPRFERHGTVNTVSGRGVHCWVFRAA